MYPSWPVIYNAGMINFDRRLRKRAQALVYQLERLCVDSSLAHRASGLRGALLRALEGGEKPGEIEDQEWLHKLIEQGDRIVVEAARQIPESD